MIIATFALALTACVMAVVGSLAVRLVAMPIALLVLVLEVRRRRA